MQEIWLPERAPGNEGREEGSGIEWHRHDGGQDGATALTFGGPQGWGEPGLQREDVVYLLGKAGLTEEATPNQAVFIVSLTAPGGWDGTEFMVPWVQLHVRKELSFYFLFFFYRNVLRKATL